MSRMAEAGNILIVDDNETNVRLLDVYLRSAGYTTEKACDGVEALEKIQAARPDLILLDVMMPRLDGYEVCRRVRADQATSVIPVIMITALKETEDRIRGLDCGADDFLTKPFDKSELLARVKNLLRVKYYRSMIAERQKFDAVIQDLSHGIVITGPDLVVTVMNRQAHVLLGFEGQQGVGRDFFSLLEGFRTRPDVAALRATDKRTLAVNIDREDVCPGIYLSGRLTRILDPAGKVANLAFVFRDVSQERRKEKLQRDFLSLVSHKLKTPLTIVSGYLGLIAAQKYGPMNADMARAFNLVGSRVQDLKVLIEKLFQFAGLSAEELRHDTTVVDLAGVVARSVARIAERYGPGRAEVETAIPADLPRALVDVEQLALVLDNLIDNAVKFTPGEPARVRILAREAPAAMVEVTVQDFGPGIPLKHQTDIFSDFLQVEDEFTGSVGGLGLGLPTAKRLVESWGGAITVASRPGEGAAFSFTVPRYREEPHETRPARPAGPGHMEPA